jgi:hypothetical protein
MRPFRWLLLAAVAAYTAALALESLALPVPAYDEPQQLVAAELVARGSVPHRDFSSPYTPLGYYLNAAALALLGRSVVSARLLACAFHGILLLALIRHVVRRMGEGWPALAVAAAGVVLIGNPFVYYWLPAYVFGFLALLAYLDWRRGRRTAWLVASGLLTGVLATAKLNFAVYLATAIAVDQAFELRRVGWASGLRPALGFAAALALPLGIYLAPYGSFVPEVLQQILVAPGEIGRHRVLTLRGAEGLRVAAVVAFPLLWVAVRQMGSGGLRRLALPLGLAAVQLGALAWTNGRQDGLTPLVALLGIAFLAALRAAGARLAPDEFAILLCAAAYGHYVLSRADPPHLAALGPWIALLLPCGLERGRPGSTVLALGLVGALFLPAWSGPLFRRVPSFAAARGGIELLGARGLPARPGDAELLMEGAPSLPAPMARLYPETDELEAMRYVRERTRPDERIYVGVKSHDRFFYSSLRSYWVAGRLPAVRDYFLLPGINTRQDVQERMIADLERDGTRWVVLWLKRDKDTDFRRRRWLGATTLDTWLAEHYALEASFGSYQVLRRRGGAPPDAP